MIQRSMRMNNLVVTADKLEVGVTQYCKELDHTLRLAEETVRHLASLTTAADVELEDAKLGVDTSQAAVLA